MRRETFSSLLARHYSYRFARAIRDQHPLPTGPLICSECQQPLRLRLTEAQSQLQCANCGARVTIPADVLAEIRHKAAEYLNVEIASLDSSARREMPRSESHSDIDYLSGLLWVAVFLVIFFAVVAGMGAFGK